MRPEAAKRNTKSYLENQESSGHPIPMASGGSFEEEEGGEEVGEGEESAEKMEDVLGGMGRETHSTLSATTRRRVPVCDGCRTQYSCSHEEVRRSFFFILPFAFGMQKKIKLCKMHT